MFLPPECSVHMYTGVLPSERNIKVFLRFCCCLFGFVVVVVVVVLLVLFVLCCLGTHTSV